MRRQFLPWLIIAANAVVLVLMRLDGFPADTSVPLRYGALHPQLVFGLGQYYRMFTSLFIHFSLMHLAMNASGLLIFGLRVEKYYGRFGFLLIYFISGLVGSLSSLLFTRGYAAGASGAVYGLVGAMLVLTFVSKREVEQINARVMLVYIAFGLALGFSNQGIDNFAHVGGLLAGCAVSYLLLKFKRKPMYGNI